MNERELKGNWHNIHKMWVRWGMENKCPCPNCEGEQ